MIQGDTYTRDTGVIFFRERDWGIYENARKCYQKSIKGHKGKEINCEYIYVYITCLKYLPFFRYAIFNIYLILKFN